MNNTTKLRGILTDVFPVENFASFSKRPFWIKQPDTEQFPQHWELELHTRDIDRLKGIHVGDEIEVEIAIRGKKFKKRNGQGEGVINTLQCIGVTVIKKMEQAPGYRPKVQPGRQQDHERDDPQRSINF